MKIRIATAALFVWLGAVLAFAQGSKVKINLDETGKAPAKSETKPIAPASPKADPGKPAPTKDGKKKEEPSKIEGIEVARGPRGFLGVGLVGGTFKISFYDANRKPIDADVATAALRWPVKYKDTAERITLQLAGDRKSLVSTFLVRPPHNFRLFISLFGVGKTEAAENYTVEFHE